MLHDCVIMIASLTCGCFPIIALS
uniref:Uncharacterized protein n=1 Tax=Anguilla anguilla TaxID=7936 RepID=A0A0E9VN63_ANGAN